MQILDMILASQDGELAANVARKLDIEPDQAQAGIEALSTALARRMERNTLSRGGLADVLALLGQGGRDTYLTDPGQLGSPDMVADGNAILQQILGSPDQSRKLAARAASQTGLSEAILKQLLPVVATMVIGALAKGAGGALEDLAGRIGLGEGGAPAPGKPEDLGPAQPRSNTGSRPRAPAGSSPLPLPGDDLPSLGRRSGGGGGSSGGGGNPLDDLSDILRRGGRVQVPRSPGGAGRGGGIELPGGAGPIELPEGGGLWGIVRTILGSLLGFESKGFLSWLIRLIVLRWGVGFLRRILSGMLGGR